MDPERRTTLKSEAAPAAMPASISRSKKGACERGFFVVILLCGEWLVIVGFDVCVYSKSMYVHAHIHLHHHTYTPKQPTQRTLGSRGGWPARVSVPAGSKVKVVEAVVVLCLCVLLVDDPGWDGLV